MVAKLRQRRIFMFFGLILLDKYIVLSQGGMDKRKRQYSPENSDNYIKVTFNTNKLK